jgi:signal transduction histidine kinase
MEDPSNNFDFSQKLFELGQLSEILVSASPNEFRQVFLAGVCKLLDVPICILWERQLGESKFKIVATHGQVDKEYQQLELDTAHPSIKRTLDRGDNIWCLPDVSQTSSRLVHIDQIKLRKWVSLLSAVVKIDGEAVGALNVFTTETRHFQSWEKNLFKILVDRVTAFLEKDRLITSSNKIEADRSRLESMISTMRKMSAATTTEEIWDILYKGISGILEDDGKGNVHILLAEVNHANSNLEIVKKTEVKGYDDKLHWQLGQGITSQAIREQKIVEADNAFKTGDFVSDIWKNARSEIAIPIIDKAQIMEGKKFKRGSKKCIGVINIESSVVNAFSDTHKQRISLLAYDASIRIERLVLYKKTQKIRNIEQAIIKSKDYDFVMNKVIDAITEILGFEWVNISRVNLEANTIKSEYVRGLDKKSTKEFIRDAEHDLGADDIQSDIVKSKEIEVPDPEDKRFDLLIYNKYGHEKFIRVFLPIIEPSSNQVIGTVEAGYPREYRQHIYEQDVTILKSLVDSAAHAIEREKARLIDRITHELRSPIVAIRGHASFVQRTFDDIRYSPQKTTIKLEDIQTDCELLFYQVGQIEYLLGKSSLETIKLEEVVVFRDIIMKTIYQLKSYINEEYNFSFDRINFNKDDANRIVVYTDRIKLNQVVFNVLMNAFKYAKRNPNSFKLSIEIDQDRNNFIVKFRDWGIGIKEDDSNNVFREGFRSSEAISKVGGSGLGLNISSTIMKQLGGDLRLVSNAEPTEFQLILPKHISGDDR